MQGVGAYNPVMMLAFLQSLGAVSMPRLVLLANHVLSSEPMAMQRMQPHCGKCIHLHLRDIPAPLSWLPSGVTVVVTAAGLLEWQPEASNGAAVTSPRARFTNWPWLVKTVPTSSPPLTRRVQRAPSPMCWRADALGSKWLEMRLSQPT